eukprot:CAMPEP_0197443972 /NCGR_PEP_ID=MMETSP1175-20131217/9578_1 /TAXON_ID=1003142 /ORGANISM="Triceratium dubium, Strain CCMP147" /LENGTH=75 /DNA_ID=CAMNT_0042974687 /DNA_START=209 /DNA_END=436 /DNA_ORIENTATION=+
MTDSGSLARRLGSSWAKRALPLSAPIRDKLEGHRTIARSERSAIRREEEGRRAQVEKDGPRLLEDGGREIPSAAI